MTHLDFMAKCVEYFGDWDHKVKRGSVYEFIRTRYREDDLDTLLYVLKLSCSYPPDIKIIAETLEPRAISIKRERILEIPIGDIKTFVNKTAQTWADNELSTFYESQPCDNKHVSELTEEDKEMMKSRTKIFFSVLGKLMSEKRQTGHAVQ